MKFYRTTFSAMGGVNEIVAVSNRQDMAMNAMELAAREVLRIEKKYSRYRDDDESIVYRINQSAGSNSPVTCDPETMELLGIADQLFKLSGGLFDITSGILRRAWNFSIPQLPAQETIDELLKLIGWGRVRIDAGTIQLPERGMEIDFGGFGKEYATDRAAAVLAQNGIKHGYVNLGGDIHAIGGQPGGIPWKFGVKDPRDIAAVIANIPITDGGLATSGDSEKFVTIDGKRYCHILNPLSGFPVECWRSVSISGVNTLFAGAYSTVAMLKESDAVSFLSESNCSYLLVDAAGRQFSNSPPTNAERV